MTESIKRLFVLNIGSPSSLLILSPEGSQIETLLPNLGVAPDGIAIDAIRRHIYWTHMGETHVGEDFLVNDGSIERVDFDGRNHKTIIPLGDTFTPKQIQCDAENGFIYWCDREGMRVMRARLDGTDSTVLIQTGSTAMERLDRRRHCVGIAIDVVGGFLYWTQKGKPDGGEGQILRAALTYPQDCDPGSRVDIEVIFENLPEPIDLEWNDESGYLYWTDRGTPPAGNTLNRVLIRPNTPFVHEIIACGFKEAIGLAIDQRNMRAFVGDLGGNLYSIDLKSPTEKQIVLSLSGPITGIAYLNDYRVSE